MLPDMVIKVGQLSVGGCVLGQCVRILYFVFCILYGLISCVSVLVFGIWYGLISSVRHKNFSWLVEVLYPTPPSPILTQSSISSLLSFSNISLFLLYTLPTNLLRPIGADNIHGNISVVISFIYKHDLIQV